MDYSNGWSIGDQLLCLYPFVGTQRDGIYTLEGFGVGSCAQGAYKYFGNRAMCSNCISKRGTMIRVNGFNCAPCRFAKISD